MFTADYADYVTAITVIESVGNGRSITDRQRRRPPSALTQLAVVYHRAGWVGRAICSTGDQCPPSCIRPIYITLCSLHYIVLLMFSAFLTGLLCPVPLGRRH